MSAMFDKRDKLPAAEAALLRAHAGAAECELVARSGTRVDVGLWWRHRPVWVCCDGQSLHVLAAGPRPHVEAVPLDALADSLYNHLRGALVLAPERPCAGNLVLEPEIAYRFLEAFRKRR